MPPPYERHVFVCTNRRPDDSPKGSCAAKGSEELPPLFKKACDAHGVKGVRINKAGCLDACERGCSVVVYPEGTWYQKVKPEDVDEIVREHLKEGRPVERLKMEPYPPKAPK
jgi:(2Fe-2S) ferredoxin